MITMITRNISNKLADAFYEEDWSVWEQLLGKRPQNHMEAEQILEDIWNKLQTQ